MERTSRIHDLITDVTIANKRLTFEEQLEVLSYLEEVEYIADETSEETVTELEGIIESLEKEVEDLKEENSELEYELKDEQDKVFALEQENRDLENEIHELREQNVYYESELVGRMNGEIN